MATALSKAQVEDRLKGYTGWALADDGQLHKEYTFKDFAQAMLFAGAVGHLADAANHHPDLNIHDYKQVGISLMTHSEGGITERDFALIGQIDALPHRD